MPSRSDIQLSPSLFGAAGNLEARGGDPVEDIAGEPVVDTERAAEPLPRLGDDVLFDPLVGGVAHRPDQDDGVVIGKSVMGVSVGG